MAISPIGNRSIGASDVSQDCADLSYLRCGFPAARSLRRRTGPSFPETAALASRYGPYRFRTCGPVGRPNWPAHFRCTWLQSGWVTRPRSRSSTICKLLTRTLRGHGQGVSPQALRRGLQKGCKIRCIKRTHRIARANQKRQKPLAGRGLYETVRRLATWHQTSEWRGQDVNL